MKLIDEIIDILSSENTNLENALIKTKVLLHKMGEKELLTWINNEINGYSKKDNIPEYRIISTSVYGTATNGYTTRWENHRLPIGHLSKKIQKSLSIQEMNESISALEILSKSENTLSAPLPTEYCPSFAKGLSNGIYVESAYKQITQTQIIQILTQIRNRLLDFLLELSDRLIESSDDDIKSQSKKIGTRELFNNTIFGDNTTIIVGNNNSNTSNQIKNNLDKLIEILKDNKINDTEIEELKTSIENDKSNNQDNESKEYGKNVKNWFKKVSIKAIENNTIRGISEALNNFYDII